VPTAEERFTSDAHSLRLGKPSDAVRGLHHCLCVDEQRLHAGLAEGTSAIVREVEALGVAELTRALHEQALDGSGGGGGGTLATLVTHERWTLGRRGVAHIVAVRLYTCQAGFRHFNGPATRSAAVRVAHSAPAGAVTTAFLSEAVCKLRLEFGAGSGAGGGVGGGVVRSKE
jgi:hypothetical protein